MRKIITAALLAAGLVLGASAATAAPASACLSWEEHD